MEWILKLTAAGDEGPCVDIMEISKPDDLGDIANLGLTLAEAKQLLARVQREISAAQAREHAVRRPVCPCRDGICRVKEYRDHAVATLFGKVRLRPSKTWGENKAGKSSRRGSAGFHRPLSDRPR